MSQPINSDEDIAVNPHSDIFKEEIAQGDRKLSIEVQHNDDGWGLQIISSNDNLTDYEDVFSSKEEAFAEARAAIAECGIDSFFW